MKDDFIEKLASIEHDRWGDWQRYCHIVLREHCPSPELDKILARWDRQIALPYGELTEEEKESDREQVRRYLPIIEQLIASREKRVAEEILNEIEELADEWTVIFVVERLDPKLEELRKKYLTEEPGKEGE